MAQETLLGFPAHTFPFRCGNLYWRRIARFPFLGFPRTPFLTAVRRIYHFIDSFRPKIYTVGPVGIGACCGFYSCGVNSPVSVLMT